MDFLSDVDLSQKKKAWWISLGGFLLLFFFGALQEFDMIDLGTISPVSETAARYHEMLLCWVLLLLILVPFMVFIHYSCRRMHVSRKLPVIAFFVGCFMPEWIAGNINDHAVSVLTNVMPKAIAKTWGSSLEATIVEEALKVLFVVWFLVLVEVKQRKQYLIAGMSAGMGFQIMEDVSDIEKQLRGSHAAFMNAVKFTLVGRIDVGLMSHWVYTGLMAVAIYLIIYQRQKKSGFLLLLSVVVNHFLWDSPVTSVGLLGMAVLATIMFMIGIYVYVQTVQDSDKEQLLAGQSASSGGTKWIF